MVQLLVEGRIMKTHIFTLMALAAILCACNKEQMIESEVIDPVVEPGASLVFNATMEDAPASKATFDNTAKCASWEVGDQINVNNLSYKAITAGTNTSFTITNVTEEIRPTYIGTSDKGCYENDNASNLVDNGGTSTRWCAHIDQRRGIVGTCYWMISVSTGRPTMLKTIRLWNANNTASYPDRVWKDIKVLGRLSSAGGDYTTIKSMYNLNLVANNSGLAGEIDINATALYDQYRIIIYNNKGDDYMQMADMKFVVSYPDPESPYTAYFPETLYNGGQTTLPSVMTETWAEGKFNMPMYAQSNTTDLKFKNLCGVLKIAVKKETIESVKSIRISSSNKAISGAFTVVNNTAELESPDTIANTVSVTYTDAVTISDEGTVFYVAIPAQTYQNLKIELSSDGVNYTNSVTTTKNVDITVARNKIYPIYFTDVVNKIGRGKAKATIDGQDVDVKWIQLWEDGPKWAEYNVGVTDGKRESYGGYYLFPHRHDFAGENWGGNWRMPTESEFRELIEKSPFRFTYVNGVGGLMFTGIGDYQNNSLFLPAADQKCGSDGPYPGNWGYYWTKTPKPDSAEQYELDFNTGMRRVIAASLTDAKSVRAVCTR